MVNRISESELTKMSEHVAPAGRQRLGHRLMHRPVWAVLSLVVATSMGVAAVYGVTHWFVRGKPAANHVVMRLPMSPSVVSPSPAKVLASPALDVPAGWGSTSSAPTGVVAQPAMTAMSKVPNAGHQSVQPNIAALSAALGRLRSLQASGSPSAREVSDALLQLEKAGGSPVMGGVRLEVLRQNLAITERMQQISAELQAISQKGASDPTAASQELVHQKVVELQELGRQLRTDVVQPPGVDAQGQ